MKQLLISFLIITAGGCRLPAAEVINVVPLPAQFRVSGEPFILNASTRLLHGSGSGSSETAGLLADQLRMVTGFPIATGLYESGTTATNAITLTTDGADTALGEEGYELICSAQHIVVRAPREAGLFYGTQTLRQLLPPQVESRTTSTVAMQWQVPGVRIWDRPRFGYRGFMLDSSRYLQSEEFVRRTIDLMAYHKLNRFHWHLTDDPGWRLEIKKYPKLTSVGAWREQHGGYGGFFTQDQVRSIVAYAAQRQITVIPEIEMPGHSAAAVASYPQITCDPVPDAAATKVGGGINTYCPGKPETFEFIENTLTEVLDLFPSAVIHIGGDECSKERWKVCPRCQAVMQRESLASEEALQSWFTGKVAAFLRSKGRRLMGWNEIMQGGSLPKDAIVHQWNDDEASIKAARAGNDVVVSRAAWTYFDHAWDRESLTGLHNLLKIQGVGEPEKTGYGITPLRRVYESDPVPPGLTPAEAAHILGEQAQLWTELRATDAAADQYIWPRLVALAEASWSPREKLDWKGFTNRLKSAHFERLALRGLGNASTGSDTIVQSLTLRSGFED
ncbi:MAG: beta-N-acetylhexosaminidase [Candidatus Sumerlaeaceae bacterium]